MELHLDGTGVIGNGRSNEQNQLLEVLVYGFSAGTFIKSHYDRTYIAGLARTVYTKDFSKDARMDMGYQVGVLYGYAGNLPNIGGFSAYILPTIGFTIKRFGFDMASYPSAYSRVASGSISKAFVRVSRSNWMQRLDDVVKNQESRHSCESSPAFGGMDSRFRGNDENDTKRTFYESIKNCRRSRHLRSNLLLSAKLIETAKYPSKPE